MNTLPVLIKRIVQKDNFHFTIDWSDGSSFDYRLSVLQKRCPCAKCHEQAQIVDEEVRAKTIKSVGRYALRIQFTTGCSLGIYSYTMLRKIVHVH